jgi:hypothetical protein
MTSSMQGLNLSDSIGIMKRLETLRRLVPQLRQEVRQDATVCTDLDV